jgi:hypothetical protein
MIISIQPLSAGQPVGELTTIEFSEFLTLNDGFSPETIAEMTAVLEMGSGYLIGGGAAGEFRLKKVDP